jgi:hypothetical protein
LPKQPFPKAIAAAVAVLSASLFFSACKENTIIPTNVVPDVDNIRVFADTLDLHTRSVADDTAITSLYVSGVPIYLGAGAITGDLFFGELQERFYFQVRPPQDNYNFDEAKYQADSAILILPYGGFSYGDTSNSAGTQTFTASRVLSSEDFYLDTIFYAHSADRAVDPTPMGKTTVSLRDLVRSKYDSTRVGNTKRSPHVRIRLTEAIMNELIGPTYTNTTSFISAFRGIQISTEKTGNTIPYFLMNGSDLYSTAGVLVYYHTINSGGGITDTLTVSYPFDPSKNAFYNKIVRNLDGTPAKAFLNSTAISDNTILITSPPGAAADIRIVNFGHIPTCVVNRAELVITQISSPMDGIFAPPVRVYPKGVDASGATYTIADRYPLSSTTALAFIDGNLRSANLGGVVVNQYVLNIPREMERAIADKKKELRLRINGTQGYPGAFRLVAGGSTYSRPQYQARLNIVYTKL